MDSNDGYPQSAGRGGDLEPEEFRSAGHDVVDWIADYFARPEQYRVQSDVEPGRLFDSLPPNPPRRGGSARDILGEFDRRIVPHLVHWNHPGFMAYFSAGGSAPGVLADALAAAVNNVGLLWRSSPALAELEQRTLDWLGGLLGLPESWFATIHDTASTATFHAVIAAREAAAERKRREGAALDLNRIVMYTSEQAHSSVEKAMAALGRGLSACRKIECDPSYALRPAALRSAIRADLREGLEPVAVVATVGTTASTGVDPVPEIADIAAEFSLWLHVDAAYAGAAALLPECRHHFEGCERADSFVVNPHKWMFVPMDLSALYTSRPEDFRRALSLVPEYLRSREHPRAVNFMEYSVPLGRRFRALKLWYVLNAFGSERIAATLREHIRLAALLAKWVDGSPRFERLAPSPFSLVCFGHRPAGATDEEADAASERLLDAVNATGEFFLSHAKLDGRYAIRVAIGNVRTTESHVRRLWHLLQTLVPR